MSTLHELTRTLSLFSRIPAPPLSLQGKIRAIFEYIFIEREPLLAPHYRLIPYFPTDSFLAPYRQSWLRAKGERKTSLSWWEEVAEGERFLRESESEAIRELVLDHIRSVLVSRRSEMCDLKEEEGVGERGSEMDVLSGLLCTLLTMLRGATSGLQGALLQCLGEIGVVDISKYKTDASRALKSNEV